MPLQNASSCWCCCYQTCSSWGLVVFNHQPEEVTMWNIRAVLMTVMTSSVSGLQVAGTWGLWLFLLTVKKTHFNNYGHKNQIVAPAGTWTPDYQKQDLEHTQHYRNIHWSVKFPQHACSWSGSRGDWSLSQLLLGKVEAGTKVILKWRTFSVVPVRLLSGTTAETDEILRKTSHCMWEESRVRLVGSNPKELMVEHEECRYAKIQPALRSESMLTWGSRWDVQAGRGLCIESTQMFVEKRLSTKDNLFYFQWFFVFCHSTAFTKMITINGQEYHLQLVDTAGQVRAATLLISQCVGVCYICVLSSNVSGWVLHLPADLLHRHQWLHSGLLRNL